jgi:hypothetical protein
LLLSSACAILPTMKADWTAVFPHRGLPPLQLTPMSGAHKALDRMPASYVVDLINVSGGRHRSAFTFGMSL